MGILFQKSREPDTDRERETRKQTQRKPVRETQRKREPRREAGGRERASGSHRHKNRKREKDPESEASSRILEPDSLAPHAPSALELPPGLCREGGRERGAGAVSSLGGLVQPRETCQCRWGN